ncbi:ATP-dependent RNA helicase [Limosilactobacillus frumenti DSM 13145]|uniref:DEAD-box ATP-dependent RNA helicase CshB n=1 Tax=Limosilactobacillus frumenti DSM 13145 TaxID=1423746 RepID=A0A0R1P8P2_9LACO|nr:DEAD/DEAH box helicase [Limosilactobacillus frumenti]KRL28585.1 ATP-dependent RNA helicase [Limosilactobacillus frumenti DSM 13145]QFG72345.1 DEAD/DEAH box helicase [Limosilactobacillus frumenti]
MTKETTFAQFDLPEYLLTAIKEINFRQPTPVQAKVIPVVLKGQSVVGQSATGSGKTHAFLLPIFAQLNPQKNFVQAVITTPSRELAYQIYAAAKQLAKYAPQPFIIHNYVGGTDKQHQIEQLQRHQPQLVIGTPGRVLDLINSQALDIHEAHQFVVDEADMTLDMGFLDQVDKIASHFPDDLQMMVFSATIPQKLRPFLKKYMENPVMEEIPTETVINPNVQNWLMSTKGRDRNQLIYQLLTMGEPYLALVFANTKERVEELTHYLEQQGLKVAMIHGGLEARRRKRTMRQVRELEYQYVVATDLAARGIDIDGVSLVINDDIPTDLEYFVHRVGRTGRNGLKGTAITLYAPAEDDLIQKLEERGIKFVPKEIRHGRLVTTHDRNRRQHYRRSKQSLDPNMKGFVKKTKRKVKPGYKKRIKRAIREDEQQKHKLEIRHRIRKAKRARQRQHRRERNSR